MAAVSYTGGGIGALRAIKGLERYLTSTELSLLMILAAGGIHLEHRCDMGLALSCYYGINSQLLSGALHLPLCWRTSGLREAARC
jgi:hypothetical protein